jgi:hypothetical protein
VAGLHSDLPLASKFSPSIRKNERVSLCSSLHRAQSHCLAPKMMMKLCAGLPQQSSCGGCWLQQIRRRWFAFGNNVGSSDSPPVLDVNGP